MHMGFYVVCGLLYTSICNDCTYIFIVYVLLHYIVQPCYFNYMFSYVSHPIFLIILSSIYPTARLLISTYCLSTYPTFHTHSHFPYVRRPSIQLYIRPSTSQWISQSTHPFISQSLLFSFHPFIDPSIHQSIHSFNDLSIYSTNSASISLSVSQLISRSDLLSVLYLPSRYPVFSPSVNRSILFQPVLHSWCNKVCLWDDAYIKNQKK